MSTKTGTLVKIWHNGRGHDYAIGCINHTQRTIGLIKTNCINNDGSIHGATKAVHKWIPFAELGDNRIVPGITRILGDREIDTRAIFDTLLYPHIAETGDSVSVVLPEHNLMANVQDNRASVTY